jgi:hypothetical protein
MCVLSLRSPSVLSHAWWLMASPAAWHCSPTGSSRIGALPGAIHSSHLADPATEEELVAAGLGEDFVEYRGS